ncbi:Sirohydrochlorin ferrochelatase [Bacillus sp. THAF10]|uniref:sirohydrochlorin chelatase n=1 Tax=Bacillus sp. THAF10 TaxID=2587848 RepID=UPI001267EAD3|nr:sirohydrochlorin chelatase [Bacillus sp. THAF10]QFT87479.1 Sirohydrochlorin ferrochelatase [Bacillus sp. THAF10]
MSKAVLYIGHGTRSKKGAEEAKSFLEQVKQRVDVPIQETSFLELSEPFIPEAFERCVMQGATEITIVPIFLLTAGHMKEDIPAALAPLREKYPQVEVSMTEAFGVQERIVSALAELVKDSTGGIQSTDSLLLVGRGSSDISIHQAFDEIRAGLVREFHISRVEVCYLAATTPLFSEGIQEISKDAEGRVIVVPYLLFAGLLLNEVSAEVRKRRRDGQDILLVEPLSRHRVIQDIVVEHASGRELVGSAAIDY